MFGRWLKPHVSIFCINANRNQSLEVTCRLAVCTNSCILIYGAACSLLHGIAVWIKWVNFDSKIQFPLSSFARNMMDMMDIRKICPMLILIWSIICRYPSRCTGRLASAGSNWWGFLVTMSRCQCRDEMRVYHEQINYDMIDMYRTVNEEIYQEQNR